MKVNPTVRTRIIGPCARALDLPLLVRSGIFFFFFCLVGADFWCVFRPFSRGGNYRLHSTWADYSSSYSTITRCYAYLNSSPLLVGGCVTKMEERMSELQCSWEICVLIDICSDYWGYRKSSHSMKLITDWNNMKDNSNTYLVNMPSMYNALKDGHPNWSLSIPWYDYWYIGIGTAYMDISLWERRDQRLSTGGMETLSDEIVVGKISESKRSNYSESNSVHTCFVNVENSQRYLIVR